MSSPVSSGLAGLVDYLKRSRGFDFTGYKPASLERRIQKRMQAAGVREYADYVDYLEVHPEEFEILFNTILINVTAFFRDEAAVNAWRKLEAHRRAQALGRGEMFGDYRLRIAGVIRDYGMADRAEVPADSRSKHG